MATIENIQDPAQARARAAAMDANELVAQHLVLRGAAHALKHVLLLGVTPETVRSMLDGVQITKQDVEVLAIQRGIQLVSEEE